MNPIMVYRLLLQSTSGILWSTSVYPDQFVDVLLRLSIKRQDPAGIGPLALGQSE
jgi:hypothetical protein